MKNLFLTIAIAVLSLNSFAQNQHEEVMQLLKSRAWFTKGELSLKESLTLTSAPEGKGSHWQATFLEHGKFMRCDSVKQDIPESEANTDITKYERFQCDSSCKLTMRANKVRIVQSGTSYYYKVIKLPVDPKTKVEKLELAILDPQQFYR